VLWVKYTGRIDRLSVVAWAAMLLGFAMPEAGLADSAPVDRPPNFIVVFCDNLGYGDIGPFGSEVHRTPHLDRMADEGLRLTSFYVTSGVCTPSRASLMTGCYPRRVNMHEDEDGRVVLFPAARKGLHPSEITLAEVLKSRGYATACIGKWHLGDQPRFLPTRQGFDLYFGIPYSDDMTADRRPGWPPLPLMRGETVVEAPADRNTLTRRYTDEAIRFITEHRDEPFFVYLPQAMPGSTQGGFATERFRGRSANGIYGDMIEELDWSQGRILAALKRLNLDERTLVIWTSDNGSYNRRMGSNRPLAGWLGSTMEGAMRVPCIVRWPGKVPAGAASDELCTTMDLLPTFAELAGAELPKDRTIDGHDIGPILFGRPSAESPYDAFYYYMMPQLQAVRSGKWKLHLPLEHKWVNFSGRTRPSPARLYDLKADIGETTNLAEEHPEIVRRLSGLAEQARRELGDWKRKGQGQRPAGMVDSPAPRVRKR
jgi:arylsulfatase A-like enzyme